MKRLRKVLALTAWTWLFMSTPDPLWFIGLASAVAVQRLIWRLAGQSVERELADVEAEAQRLLSLHAQAASRHTSPVSAPVARPWLTELANGRRPGSTALRP
jgi:hypothetical protein